MHRIIITSLLMIVLMLVTLLAISIIAIKASDKKAAMYSYTVIVALELMVFSKLISRSFFEFKIYLGVIALTAIGFAIILNLNKVKE